MAPWILAEFASVTAPAAVPEAGAGGLCAASGRAHTQRIASQRRINRGWTAAAARPAIFMRHLSLEQKLEMRDAQPTETANV
jgi:hypothetical protein